MHDEGGGRRGFLRQAALGAVTAAGAAWGVAGAVGQELRRGSRISYFRDGEIHVAEVGQPEGTPITSGHWDFKPSWSKTGDMLVCFRRLRDDPVTEKWKTAIFVVNADGTGFHLLTSGAATDFNPTWSRDGSNTPIWNRRNDRHGGYVVLRSRMGSMPGTEITVTDESFHTWAHSCLMDGRILVTAAHPKHGRGVYLLSARDGAKPMYEPVTCELAKTGQVHRASISPSERRICFEYLAGAMFTEPGHTLYVADFDVERRTIANPVAIANDPAQPFWYAYPRWIEGESAVIYHRNRTGKGELCVHRLRDGSTTRVSTDPHADYRYPHGEAAPC